LNPGTLYGGGIVINSTRDTVVVDTAHMFSLDSGSTYVLYVIDPNAQGVFDSIVFSIPAKGAFIPPPVVPYVNKPPVATADTFAIAEDQTAGFLLGTVVASDPEDSVLTYRLKGSGPFRIDSLGRVFLTGSVDYEGMADYSLSVVVNDGKDSVTVSLRILVTNVAEPVEIRIVSVQAGDSLWSNDPDTVWTNQLSVRVNGRITGTLFGAGKDSSALKTVKQGVNKLGMKICTSDLLACGIDSVLVLVNTAIPSVSFQPLMPDTTGLRYLVYEYIPSDTFFTNDPWAKIQGTLISTGGDLKKDTSLVSIDLGDLKLKDGVNRIPYSFTDVFGNMVAETLLVVLDRRPPAVVIANPLEGSFQKEYTIDVEWLIEGVVMDSLTRASLEKGNNTIIRRAMDRAGNLGADTVMVILKIDRNDVIVDLVKPVVVMNPKDVDKAFSKAPPRKDERYAFTAINRATDLADEIAYGTSAGTVVKPKSAKDQRTYGLEANTHVGPTLHIQTRLQSVGGVNAEGDRRTGTLQDLMEWIGEKGGVDTAEALCGLNIPQSQWEVRPLWRNSVTVEADIFDNMGQYIDRFVVSADSLGAQYLNDGGVAEFNLALTPDKESKNIKDSRGRTLASGAYLVRGVVRATSTYLWCAGEFNQGEQVKSIASILKAFGYRRYDK
jgi:hypothetical protein